MKIYSLILTAAGAVDMTVSFSFPTKTEYRAVLLRRILRDATKACYMMLEREKNTFFYGVFFFTHIVC